MGIILSIGYLGTTLSVGLLGTIMSVVQIGIILFPPVYRLTLEKELDLTSMFSPT